MRELGLCAACLGQSCYWAQPESRGQALLGRPVVQVGLGSATQTAQLTPVFSLKLAEIRDRKGRAYLPFPVCLLTLGVLAEAELCLKECEQE